MSCEGGDDDVSISDRAVVVAAAAAAAGKKVASSPVPEGVAVAVSAVDSSVSDMTAMALEDASTDSNIS